MKTIQVPVYFSGEVTVHVPDTCDEHTAKRLAETLALVRIAATTDNPDAPEDAAFGELADELLSSEEKLGKLWDQSIAASVGGSWTTEAAGAS